MDELSQGVRGRDEDLEKYLLRTLNLVISGEMRAYERLRRRRKSRMRGPCHGKQGKRFQKHVHNVKMLITNANI